jgi:drug/metabolite transporter (DMT)-like permease
LTTRRDDLQRAALFMTGSALLFASMGVSVKVASQSLPNTVVVFFRNGFGLLALVPWLVPLGWSGLKTTRLRDHLPRVGFGLMSMYCFFYAIGHMPLSDAVLINYSLPLFIPLIEGWYGEPIPRGIWGPVFVGLAGIVLILKPGSGMLQGVALVAVLSAVFGGFAQVGVRKLTSTEPTPRIVFYFAALASVASAAPLPWVWRTPPPALWPVLLAMGVLATLGQLLMTRAYSHSPAARVGPFMYTSVVFAAVLDFLFWRVVPDGLSLAGAALVVVAGVLALRIDRGRAAEAPPVAVSGSD